MYNLDEYKGGLDGLMTKDTKQALIKVVISAWLTCGRERAALETYSAILDFFSPIIVYTEKVYDSSKESSIHY